MEKKEKQKRLTALGPNLDLITFSEKYFGFKNSWHHKLMYDILDNFVYQDKETGKLFYNKGVNHKGWIAQEKGRPYNKTIMFLVPRNHGKSTIVSFVYPIYEIVRNRNVRILVVSANVEIAKSFVRQTILALENNEKLIRDFGSFEPKTVNVKKWGEKAFIVRRDTMEKDPTMVGAGFGERIVSKRADIIILDDIIDLERARTKFQRQKMIEWFGKVLYPILSPGGRIVVVGTKWFKGDFYDIIETEKDFDIKLKLKAFVYNSSKMVSKLHGKTIVRTRMKSSDGKKWIVNLPYNPYKDERLALDIKTIFDQRLIEAYGLGTKTGFINTTGVLWPEERSYEWLISQKRVMGEDSFYSQYLNEPISPQSAIFKKTYVDEAMKMGKYYQMPNSWDNVNFPTNFPRRQMVVMMGVDLAATVGKKSDFSAIAVWGLDKVGYRWLLHLEKFKGGFDEIQQRVLDIAHLYNPMKVVVESNNFQDVIRQGLSEDLNVVGMRTTAVNKFDVERGLVHIAVLLEQRKIVIPNFGSSQITAQSFYKDLINTSRDGHTPDTVMASWFALYHLKEYSELIEKSSGYIDRETLAYQTKKAVFQPHRLMKTGFEKPTLNFSANSVVSYFGDKSTPSEILADLSKRDVFVSVYFGERGIAYFFDRYSGELLLSIDGNLSIIFFADTLQRYSVEIFRDVQMCVLLNNRGEALLYQLRTRNIDNLYVAYPLRDGTVGYGVGVKADSFLLPQASDYLRFNIRPRRYVVKDRKLIKEMSQIVDISDVKIETVTGKEPHRFIAFAVGYYLLKEYNYLQPKTLQEKQAQKNKFGKGLIANPYAVFNSDY